MAYNGNQFRKWSVPVETVDFKEACTILNVSKRTLYRWIAEKKIIAAKAGRSYRFDRSTLMKMMNFPDPAISTFARLYGENCRVFLEGIIDEIKPDYIVTENRFGERAINAFQLLPSSFPKDRIFVISSLRHRASKRLEELLNNKRVLLLDEAAERAISLYLHREWLEKYGAIVVTAVLAILEKGIKEQRIQEFPIRYALKLGNYDYRRFTATMLDALTVSGVSLDIDHLSLMLDIRDSKLVDELMAQTAQLGRIHRTRSYVHPTDIKSNFVTKGWTLDDPTFISMPRILSFLQPDNSVIKFRFDAQLNGVRCVIVVTNKMKIDLENLSSSLLSHFGDAKSMLPKDWNDMSDDQKALYIYESTLLIWAAEMYRQFAVIAKKGASRELQDAIDSANVEESEICAIFDRELDHAVISLASDIAKGAPRFPSGESMPISYTQPIPLISPFSSVLPRSANFHRIAIETFRKHLEAQTKAQKPLGLSRDELAVALLKDYRNIDYVTFSRYLDEMLDQGMMKPNIRIDQLENRSFSCIRIYQLGERSGYKSPVPPSFRDKTGISREMFEMSHSMTTGMRNAERALVVMETVTHHIASRLDISSVPDILLNKVLSNMTLDWMPIDNETWPFIIRNFVFGTMVEAPSEPSSIRERVLLGELASRSSILKHDWKGSGDLTESKSGQVHHFPPGAVILDTSISDDYLAERIEEFIPTEVYQLRSLTDTYLEILSMEKEPLQNPSTLVALAIGRSQRTAYAQLHTQLRLWHEYIDSSINRCINIARSKRHNLNITEETRKEIIHKINLAEECFYQFDLKMALLKRMPELVDKIKGQKSIDAVNRRKIHASTHTLQLDGINAEFPIASLSFMKMTFRALNTVAASIIRNIIDGTAVPPLPKNWDVERITGTRETIRQLREAISKQQPEPIVRALLALYIQMRTNFDKLPKPVMVEEDWQATLQELYSRIKIILDKNLRGKQVAMAYIDILGFRELTTNLVAAGNFINVDDAREAWWNTVNSAIERVIYNTKAVSHAVGGDGWLLYMDSPYQCLELINSLIVELQKEDWELPCIGIGFGPAEPTGAGAYDVEAMLAYLASEQFKGFGKVLVTESVYRKVVEEDSAFSAYFSEKGKISAPRPGADEVSIYEYIFGEK
jgi:excisionase family DNA binding protein